MIRLKNWCLASLGDVAEIINGKNQKHVENPNGEFPIYGSAGVFGYANEYLCEAGSTVIGRKGTINNPIFVNEKFWNVDTAFGITPYSPIWAKYLYYYFTGFNFYALDKSTTIPSLAKRDLLKIEIPISPTNEQHRIVAKIEELFSELDKGIESLKKAREQLKIYRQAVLKHAFEGKLTEKWREENADKLETADQLFARIQKECEARYQQQLEKWKENIEKWEQGGKQGRKPTKPIKLKEMASLFDSENIDYASIPNEWVWVRYGDLCSVVRNGISKKPGGEKGQKIFRISAVRPMYFDMSDYRHIDNSNGEYDNYFLDKNDLVFTRYNGSKRYVGVCAMYKSSKRILFPDKLIQTRPDLEMLSASYLEKALNSGVCRKFIETKIRTTAGQSGVSGSDVKNIPIPICSASEQTEISSYLDAIISEINESEKIIEKTLCKAEILRQSILKKAFSGQLVEQDPNDEPASVLLERIKEEKEKQIKSTPKKKRTKKRKTAA